jgi:hypothetical protein
MVSSGTGQTPIKPSQGVLFLLQRSGLMAMNQSEYSIFRTTTAANVSSTSQGATSDHIFWVSILVTHAALPAMGAVVAISPNGGGAGIVSDPGLPAFD